MNIMCLSAEKFTNPLHSALLSYTGPTFETFVSIINAEINAFPLLQHIKLLKFSTFFFSSDGHPHFSGVHQLLPLFYSQILHHSPTTPQANKQTYPVPLGGRTRDKFLQTTASHVYQSSPVSA